MIRFNSRQCFLLFFMLAALSFGQQIDYPNKPQLKEYVSEEYKCSIGFPSDWALDTPARNEIWFCAGTLRGAGAGAMVRISKVGGLHLTTAQEFVKALTKEKFLELNKPATPDIEIQLFDEIALGGLPARRIIYTATDSGTKLTTVSYQTLKGDCIFTVLVVCAPENFPLLFNDFETIADSFQFSQR